MNKIEVISDNEILNDIQGIVVVPTDKDTIRIEIEGIHNEPIVFINNIYKNVLIKFNDYAVASLFEIKEHITDNFSYKYNIGENSKAVINKFYHMGNYNEEVLINLNGYKANVTFNLSTISSGSHLYNININHNNQKTVSNICNRGITVNSGDINIVVNGTVKKGMKDSILDQDNKVMTLGSGKSTIKPNLYIDEDMVEARHGASIGRFNEEEVFYLKTRGVPEDKCYQLLLKGFLLSNFEYNEKIIQKLEHIIDKLRR